MTVATARPIPPSPELDHVLRHADAIRAAVEAAGASNPRVIGSVARGEGSPDGRLDLLIDARPGLTYFKLFDLERDLSILLGIEVEIETEGGNPASYLDRLATESIAL